MKLKTQICSYLLIGLRLRALRCGQAPERDMSEFDNRGRVAGNDGYDSNNSNQTRPPFPAIMTFYRDGNLTAYANPPGGSPLDTPEAGLWQREPGCQNYSHFHDISYLYDENGFLGRG